MAIWQFERNPKSISYMYISKVKKFQVCACMHLDSVKDDIKGADNLQHLLERGLRGNNYLLLMPHAKTIKEFSMKKYLSFS